MRPPRTASLFAALLAGCLPSGDDAPAGELVVSIETNLKVPVKLNGLDLPGDIDSVQVSVSSQGVSKLDQTYALGPSGVEVPATLGLTAPSDPSADATVRVQASKSGRVRVVRQVVTSVPQDRVALLHLPIEWLCDGMTACPAVCAAGACVPGTCVGGQCESAAVDATSLEDYTPGAVFGGGNGGLDANGVCLDTVPCFSGGRRVDVDRTGCTIAKPSEPGHGVNVALVLPPSGDGICSLSTGPSGQTPPCLVPLDYGVEGGFRDVGGRIALPKSVCQKLADSNPPQPGKILGVALTTTCSTKTPGVPTCGPWSSVQSNPGTFFGAGPSGM